VRERKTSEILDLAADVVEQRGWTTGSWNNAVEGAPVCIEGGIAAAMGWEVNLGVCGNETYREFQACPAYVAVKEYLGITGEYLYFWNDAVAVEGTEFVSAHSQQEVIEVLRAAAAVERAKEAVAHSPEPLADARRDVRTESLEGSINNEREFA
jgi:hypothetical protein